MPQNRRFVKNKDIFIHYIMGEATGHLLVTVHLASLGATDITLSTKASGTCSLCKNGSPKNINNHLLISLFLSLYSVLSPRSWIFLHHDCPRWKRQHFSLPMMIEICHSQVSAQFIGS